MGVRVLSATLGHARVTLTSGPAVALCLRKPSRLEGGGLGPEKHKIPFYSKKRRSGGRKL